MDGESFGTLNGAPPLPAHRGSWRPGVDDYPGEVRRAVPAERLPGDRPAGTITRKPCIHAASQPITTNFKVPGSTIPKFFLKLRGILPTS